MQNSKSRIKNMVLIALMAVIISICSWIYVPAAIPFTLQTLGVFLCVTLLGGKKGTLAIILYLALGLVGLPVFAGGTAGPGILLGATGGYLLGFIAFGITVWVLESADKNKKLPQAAFMAAGLALCYTFGTVWFFAVYANSSENMGWLSTLAVCVLPYILPDTAKMTLAIILGKRLSRHIK